MLERVTLDGAKPFIGYTDQHDPCSEKLYANTGIDFLPVLKHRDSGIGVVPVVRVSLTVASSRRGEMESYTVSARV